MRQIGLAMQMYLNESKGQLPRYDSLLPDGKWYQRLLTTKMLGSDKVLFCPERRPIPIVAPDTTEEASALTNGYISYGINLVLTYPYTPYTQIAKISQIRYPAETILAVESRFTDTTPTGIYVVYPYNRSVGDTAWMRHPNGGCNVLWVDGHVSTVHAKQATLGNLYASFGLTNIAFEVNNWDRE
jgi:prepilin-type processing-associated H-X9-DG protein